MLSFRGGINLKDFMGGDQLSVPPHFLIDLFDRDDGDLGSKYVADDTYSISSYAALNTPSLGAEIALNAGFEGVYVGGVAPSWINLGSGTPSEENIIVHGGSASQKLVAVANNDRIVQSRNVLTAGNWYRVSVWLYTPAPGVSNVRLRVGTSTANATYGSATCTATGAWQEVVVTFRALSSSCTIGVWLLAGATAYIDDISLKQITTDDTFMLYQPHGTRYSLLTVETLDQLEYTVQAGLCCRMSLDKSSGVVVWVDDNTNTVNLAEIVSDTWTILDSQAVSVSNNAVLRIDDNGAQEIKVYYADTLEITATISNVTANNNLYVGLFATAPETVLRGFVVAPYGITPTIYRYVATTGNDADPGSESAPKLTLNGAGAVVDVNRLVNYISVGAGTYTENVIGRGGTTYIANGSVTIDGNNASHAIYVNGVDYTVIDGFTVVNASPAFDCVLFNNSDDGIVRNCTTVGGVHGIQFQASSHRPTITQCIVTGTSARGIGIYNGCEEASISYCYIHSPGAASYAFEIELNCDDSVVAYVWATGYTHGFITKLCDNTTFSRCVAFNNTSLGFYCKGSTNTKIYNCDSYNNMIGVNITDNAGVAPQSTGTVMYNTIISGNTTNSVYVQIGSEPGTDMDYNDYHNNGVWHWAGTDFATFALWQANSGQDGNGLNVDPLYGSLVYGGFVPQEPSVLTGADDGGPQGHTG